MSKKLKNLNYMSKKKKKKLPSFNDLDVGFHPLFH